MGTVLIVDDEAGIRDGLARAVGSKGHKAVLAATLGEAREALRAGECDCVLRDVRLPDGDGLDLLREIRSRPGAETPVIMATAYGDSERTIAAMRDGAFEYLTKPFDLPHLLETVDRAVITVTANCTPNPRDWPIPGDVLAFYDAAGGFLGTGRDLLRVALQLLGGRGGLIDARG